MKRSILPGPNTVDPSKQTTANPTPTSTNWDRPKPKRKLTEAACRHCRTRRRRCTGGQPCVTCQANNQECIYETSEGESNGQSLKRKYAQIQQDRDELRELFTMISTTGSQRSIEIIERIRNGQNASTILKHIQHADILLQTTLNSERHARHALLSSLMQTSASFDDLVEFITTTVASNSGAKIPGAALFRQLRGQRTDLGSLRKLLGYSNPPRRIAISDLLSDTKGSVDHTENIEDPLVAKKGLSDEKPRQPPFRVPARPWTTVTDDESLVSHLTSIFLEYVNPAWRLVEQDLLVEAMQSQDPNSEYCSPFLVNAMLSLAALSSEREDVFVQTDDYMTRGQQFHEEALRLWYRQEGKASLRNLNALCVLFISSVVRGKDKLGVSLMAVIAQMNRDVPKFLTRPNKSAKEAANYERARQCVAWATFLCDLATSNTILKSAHALTCREDLMQLSTLPDLPPVWSGYPYHRPMALEKNILFLETCKLSQLAWKAQNLLFASDRTIPGFQERAETLAGQMLDWKKSLPEALQSGQRKTLPAPVFDLHYSYFSVLTGLYSLFQPIDDNQLSQPADTTGIIQTNPDTVYPNDGIALRMHQQAIACARDTADMIGDFRMTYGLKIIMPYMVQANGVACFTLLPELSDPASQAAFKEAFRCLLGAGMQLLWARGMARMLHLTAQNTGIILPKSIMTMLEAVSDTAWRKSDTEMLSSCWPNYVVLNQTGSGESVTMEDLIKKWESLEI